MRVMISATGATTNESGTTAKIDSDFRPPEAADSRCVWCDRRSNLARLAEVQSAFASRRAAINTARQRVAGSSAR